MGRINGKTLATLWPSLTSSEKESIVARLRSCYKELRQLPSPGYYGSIGKRCLLDEIFWTRDAEPTINGPFATEGAINEAMARKYTHDGIGRIFISSVFHAFSMTISRFLLINKNIMIWRDPQRTQTADNRSLEVVILDWGKSGWYPSYWEWTMTGASGLKKYQIPLSLRFPGCECYAWNCGPRNTSH